jgi:hypothetical protein
VVCAAPGVVLSRSTSNPMAAPTRMTSSFGRAHSS